MSERDTPTLGVLEEVELRDIWGHEAHKFIPWLAENLALLGSVLGIELECEDTEVTVSALRADIVARIVGDDSQVIIENQLEEADLKHLGALLAYVAGLEATPSLPWRSACFASVRQIRRPASRSWSARTQWARAMHRSGELTELRKFASTQFRMGTGGKPVGGPGVKGGRSPAEWTFDARTHEGHAWFGSKAAECCFRRITAWETPSWRTRYSEPRSA